MPSERRMCLACVALIVVIGGCASAPQAPSLCTTLPPAARDGPRFWAELAQQRIATNDDALHAILLLLDDVDDCPDYRTRLTTLRSRGVIPNSSSFDAPANQAVGRGALAVALTRILGIRGGITMSLLGTSERYAVRELEFRDLFPPSTPNQIFSGGELVGVLDRVYSYVAGDPTNYPAGMTRAQMRGKGRIAVAHRAPLPFEIPNDSVAISDAPVDELLGSSPPLYLSIDEFTLNQPIPGTRPATTSSTPTTGLAFGDSTVFTVVNIEARHAEALIRPDDADFVPCTVGMKLFADSQIRTDLKGLVYLETNGAAFTVCGATAVSIRSAIDSDGQRTTSLIMPNGAINLEVEKGGPFGNAEVQAPKSTLAVRGTQVSLYEQRGFEPRATSLTGTAEFENFRRQKVLFGKAGTRAVAAARYGAGSAKYVVTGAVPDAADVAYRQTVVDPTLRGARTDSEQQLVAQFISRGSVVRFDQETGLLIVTGGSKPSSFNPLFQGIFNVVLKWDANVNLNLGVASPGTDEPTPPRPAEFVYPSVGLTKTPNGGVTRFDHRGGGSGGYEVVSFAHYDNGPYAAVVESVNAKSAQLVPASLQVFLGDQPDPVREFNIDVPPNATRITTIDLNDSGGFPPFGLSRKRSMSKKPAAFVGPMRPAAIPAPAPVGKSVGAKRR